MNDMTPGVVGENMVGANAVGTNTVQAPPDDVVAVDDGSVSVDLTKAIPAYTETIKAVKFKKPNIADLLAVGANPFTFDPISDPPRLLPEAAALNSMMARLAQIPTSSIELLSGPDRARCARALSPLFVPATMEMTAEKDAPDGDGSVTIMLPRQLQNAVSGQMVEKIKFRQSIGRDEAQIGTPLEFNEFAVPVPSIKHFIPRMHAMLQRLSGLPASVFEQMEVSEWLACAWAVSRFFMPLEASAST
jgi:hypothetical protein